MIRKEVRVRWCDQYDDGLKPFLVINVEISVDPSN